jgi:hypothetical protein
MRRGPQTPYVGIPMPTRVPEGHPTCDGMFHAAFELAPAPRRCRVDHQL